MRGAVPAGDSRAFLKAGYSVTAFDAAEPMAELASEHIGQPVEIMRFQDVAWAERFDGIWACASLLHVPRPELPDVFQRLTRALKPGGVLYISFKYGNEDRKEGRRNFTDLDEAGLAALLEQVPGLHGLEQWVSGDRRADRAHERWLNALLGKD
ncbi:MAG: class I SAM-dependent methyltransferase [Arhodomonas sp.]|nr:class I SAM-dependent methyltransferase [Arhodomonas sp.]